MAGAIDPLANPFKPQPRDPWRDYAPLTVEERLSLSKAPRRTGPGTMVTVRSYEVPKWPLDDEHMYVEYDDGREQLIARGGPSAEGGALVKGALRDDLHVVGGVAPAHLSKDFAQGERVMLQGFLPGVTAQEAAIPARLVARRLDRDPRRYRRGSNSNSYAADAVEPLFGMRPGDVFTPGWDTRLGSAPRVQPMPPGNPFLMPPTPLARPTRR